MTTQPPPSVKQLIRRPLWALIALIILVIATTGLAFVHMGPMNLVVSLLIAGAKVAIIVVIFMELLKGSGVQILAAAVGVFWLTFLFLLAFSDYLSR